MESSLQCLPEAEDDSLRCTICLENFFTSLTAASSCGHVFHYECISKMNGRHLKCPNCNSLFEKETLLRLIPVDPNGKKMLSLPDLYAKLDDYRADIESMDLSKLKARVNEAREQYEITQNQHIKLTNEFSERRANLENLEIQRHTLQTKVNSYKHKESIVVIDDEDGEKKKEGPLSCSVLFPNNKITVTDFHRNKVPPGNNAKNFIKMIETQWIAAIKKIKADDLLIQQAEHKIKRLESSKKHLQSQISNLPAAKKSHRSSLAFTPSDPFAKKPVKDDLDQLISELG
jgi:Ring finger domain